MHKKGAPGTHVVATTGWFRPFFRGVLVEGSYMLQSHQKTDDLLSRLMEYSISS